MTIRPKPESAPAPASPAPLISNIKPENAYGTINALTFPFMVVDSSHRILFANQSSSSFLSADPEDLVNAKCPRFQHKTYRLHCPLDAAIKSKKPEEQIIFDEKHDKWYSSMVFPLPFVTVDGLPTFVQIAIDITEKKISENNLIQEKKRINALAESFLSLIQKMIETRDPYLANHHKAAASIAVFIAMELELPHETIEGIRIATLVHDIGKISIPPEILARSGVLSELEFAYIKGHPGYGRDLIAPIDFPWPISEIIFQHHERENGSGYPRGLKGDQICIEAKILIVAEVVEAMCSHRPYRPAYPIEQVLEEIEKQSGILYDASVVKACLDLFLKRGYKAPIKEGIID